LKFQKLYQNLVQLLSAPGICPFSINKQAWHGYCFHSIEELDVGALGFNPKRDTHEWWWWCNVLVVQFIA